MKNKYSKIIYIILVAIIYSASAFSQDAPNHEFSASISGAHSSLIQKANIGDNKGGIGGSFGVGYTYFLTTSIGLSTGLEVSMYKSEYNADAFSSTLSNVVDPSDGESFDFVSSVSNYAETQSATYLNIPLQLQYQLNAFSSNQFYMLGGLKIGIPLKSSYETTKSNFVNNGFFHETGVWGGNSQEFMSFGNYDNMRNEGDAGLKISYTLSAEAGLKWSISNKLNLYTGLFIDYGLNNIGGNNKNFVALEETNTGMGFSSNSVLSSYYNQDNKANKFIDKASVFAGGVKIRISIYK